MSAAWQVVYWHDRTHTASHYVDAETAAEAVAATEAAYPGQVFEPEPIRLERRWCNCCLRDVAAVDDPGNGLCGPCHRGETPESQ